METYTTPPDPFEERLDQVERYFPSLISAFPTALNVYGQCLDVAQNDEAYIRESRWLLAVRDAEQGVVFERHNNTGVFRTPYGYVPEYLFEQGAKEELEQSIAFGLAFNKLSMEVGSPRQTIQEVVDTFKGFLILKLVDFTTAYEVGNLAKKPGLSQIAKEFDTVLSKASEEEREYAKAELAPFFEELVAHLTSPNKSKALHSGRVKAAFGTMFHNGFYKEMTQIYEDLPMFGSLTRVDLYGIDSTQAEDLIDEMVALQDRGKGISTRQHLSLQSQTVDLVLRTIKSVGSTCGIENAQKISSILERNKTRLSESSGVTTVTFSSIIQLANGLLGTINSVIEEPAEKLTPLGVDLDNLSEAFRRIMFVVFDGNEDDKRAEEFRMEERFRAVDMFVETTNEPTDKSGARASGRQSRGQIPSRGQTYWKRWRPSYGIIT